MLELRLHITQIGKHRQTINASFVLDLRLGKIKRTVVVELEVSPKVLGKSSGVNDCGGYIPNTICPAR